MLVLENLSIGYGTSVVQQNLSLSARSGEMICLLGTNGCGKSTLLRTLTGLQPVLSGACKVDKDGSLVDAATLSEKERSMIFSVVLTERLSADNTTVRDVVAMGRYPYVGWLGGLSAEDNQIIEAALSQTEMLSHADDFFQNLSDGEKQRVLIAKALAQQTPFIFLDEPTAHLDLPNRIKTLLLLRRLAHETGRTVLISTHELDLALQTADTIWLMTPHRGVEVGSPEQLISNGAFQRAFADSSFSFVSSEGALKIQIKQ